MFGLNNDFFFGLTFSAAGEEHFDSIFLYIWRYEINTQLKQNYWGRVSISSINIELV